MSSAAQNVDIAVAYDATRPFARSSNVKAYREIFVTLAIYASLWVVAVSLVENGSWLFVPVCVFAAVIFMRIFLLFHDCLHANLFETKRANQICAFLLGLLFFVPSRYWTEEHLAHHATSQNLDRRGRGDVVMLTVEEYLALSPFNRLAYRLLRTMPGLFLVEMIGRWQILYRLPATGRSKEAAAGIIYTNIGLVVVQGSIILLAGWQNYLIVFGLIYLVGGCLGVWLFVSQHDFEESVWERNADWSLKKSPWAGSSFLDLPVVGHWLLNNVSYHHIHHLNPRIPGYNLAACHNSNPIFATAPTINLAQAWKCWKCQLWDEDKGKLVSTREAERDAVRDRDARSADKDHDTKDGSHGLFDVLYDGTVVTKASDAAESGGRP